MYLWFIGVAGALLVCGLAAGYSRSWMRWLVVAAVIANIPAVYIAATELLGLPKPQHAERLRTDTKAAEVRGWHIVRGKAIYLLLYAPQWGLPRYYVYPWTEGSEETAGQLRQGWQRAQDGKLPLFMVRPFDPSLDPEAPRFRHDPPQPAMPPKAGAGR